MHRNISKFVVVVLCCSPHPHTILYLFVILEKHSKLRDFFRDYIDKNGAWWMAIFHRTEVFQLQTRVFSPFPQLSSTYTCTYNHLDTWPQQVCWQEAETCPMPRVFHCLHTCLCSSAPDTFDDMRFDHPRMTELIWTKKEWQNFDRMVDGFIIKHTTMMDFKKTIFSIVFLPIPILNVKLRIFKYLWHLVSHVPCKKWQWKHNEHHHFVTESVPLSNLQFLFSTTGDDLNHFAL